MNIIDILILAVCAALLILAVINLIKSKKRGECCGSCRGCAYYQTCRQKDAGKCEEDKNPDVSSDSEDNK